MAIGVLLDRFNRAKVNFHIFDTLDANLTYGDLVGRDEGTGKVVKATCDAPAIEAIGIVVGRERTGDKVHVQFSGPIKNLSGLIAHDEYFLGPNGTMSTTPPTDDGDYVQKIGWAKDSTTFILAILDFQEL